MKTTTIIGLALCVTLIAGCGPKTEAEKKATEEKAKERIQQEQDAKDAREAAARRKQNQKWFEANKAGFSITLTNLGFCDVASGLGIAATTAPGIVLRGNCENSTPKEIGHAVVSIVIQKKGVVSYTEKLAIPVSIFPRARIPLDLRLRANSSRLRECATQLGEWEWRPDLVTAIPTDSDCRPADFDAIDCWVADSAVQ